MYASPTKCTQIGRGVRMQKKNATEVIVCLAFDFTALRSGAFITRGSPMLSPFVLAKGIISQVCRFFLVSKGVLCTAKKKLFFLTVHNTRPFVNVVHF